jgi:hypothetical protein
MCPARYELYCIYMSISSAGLEPENDCSGENRRRRPMLTNPQLSDCNENLVMAPKWLPDIKIERPSVVA